MHILLFVAICYLTLNFVCALLLHLHGLRQAHLPLRFLDILMHFLLLTALAIPLLLVFSAEALFGGKDQAQRARYHPVPQHH